MLFLAYLPFTPLESAAQLPKHVLLLQGDAYRYFLIVGEILDFFKIVSCWVGFLLFIDVFVKFLKLRF